MTARPETFKYVTFNNILAYMAVGWIESRHKLGGPHADYAVLMEWLCECEPRQPNGGGQWTSVPQAQTSTNTERQP
jgi:hypothetical protein